VTATSGAPVVVGVDGTESARRAVRLGAAEARLRRCPLRLVHALIWPVLRVAPGTPRDGPRDGGLRRRADAVLGAAMSEATEAAPGISVSGGVVDGLPAAVLLRESRTAALIVVGHRGLRALSGLFVGSVAVQVAAQARCPVLVMLGDRQRDTGPVVVGVDGTVVSDPAVRFAFTEAALRGTELVALHAGNSLPAAPVGPWRQRFPQVRVTPRLAPGRPAPALIDESARAQLVVTGSVGRGTLAGLVRGSVSQAVLRDSHCPLAIVRRAAAG
jgi:nucleotide-binding universal stress UspA family protein